MELVRRLEEDGFFDKRCNSIEFLGLYDPVYSYGRPGQDSKLITFTPEGKAGNYVTRKLSSKVDKAAVIYAMNETRSWFPATKVTKASGSSTEIVNIGSPGMHSDVGGHWECNQYIQQLTLRTMINQCSEALFTLQPDDPIIDPQLQAILNSDYTVYLAMKPPVANGKNITKSFAIWDNAQDEALWTPYTPEEYCFYIKQTAPEFWLPGPMGAQDDYGKKNEYNDARLLPFTGYYYIDRDGNVQKTYDSQRGAHMQPYYDHYRRDLNWVEKGLWDTYNGISLDVSKFIKDKLYKLIVHPKGGWRYWFGYEKDFGDYKDITNGK